MVGASEADTEGSACWLSDGPPHAVRRSTEIAMSGVARVPWTRLHRLHLWQDRTDSYYLLRLRNT